MPGMDIIALSSALGRDSDSSETASLIDNLAAATGSSSYTRLKAEVSAFPDVTFHNYHALGVSFSYIPSTTSTQASSSKLVLDRIDIYNADPTASAAAPPTRPGRRPKPTFSRFPLDLTLTFPTTSIALPPPQPAPPSSTTSSKETSATAPTTREREKTFVVRAQTRGRDFVAALGEPSRKGGGAGGVGGFAGVSPWMEWNDVELEVGEPQGNDENRHTARIGLMVELRDPGGAEVLTEEQRKKGAGGVWDRAANWQWTCLKVFPAGTTQ